MKAKRAAIYLRCSTKSQETQMQEVEITDFCSHRGWEYKIYRDTGQSGSKESRPALDFLLSDVRKRRVDVIAVWALDRLARSLKQLLSIAEECRSLGVDLVSLKQNVDTTLPTGRLTFQILGAVAAATGSDLGVLRCVTLTPMRFPKFVSFVERELAFAAWQFNTARRSTSSAN